MLRPDGFAARIADISIKELVGSGVRGVIVDLDDTLVGRREKHPNAGDAAWIAAAGEAGLKVVVVSNNVRSWVKSIADTLNIEFVHRAYKPLPPGFQRALRMLGTQKSQTMVIGDQVFTDVLGARLLGVRVILTDPIGPQHGFWMTTLRRLEDIVIRRPAGDKSTKRQGR